MRQFQFIPPFIGVSRSLATKERMLSRFADARAPFESLLQNGEQFVLLAGNQRMLIVNQVEQTAIE
jgi:hypothetical protein